MKKFKKILSCIMTVIMCVFLFSGVDFKEASAEILEFEFPTSKGTLYYKISNNEVEIQAYIGKDTKLEIPSKINGKSVTTIRYGAFDNCGSLTSIVIPDSVTSIGNNAFYNCDSLTSIVIPDSVTSIGDNVFCGCSSLTSIAIPDSVTSIGDSAFSFCSSLTSITIPNSVTSIGDSAFSLCRSLTSITIPNSVTSIGDSAFDYCYSLISIIIPDSVTSIGDFAFNNCDSLTSITIPNSVSSIENCTFMNCDSLTSIEIPNSVTSIGNGAFRNCDSLTSIEIPNSVTSIGNYAFADCDGLTSIEIPDSVSSIGIGTFSDCDSLTNINVNNKNYIDKDGILFSKDEKTLIQYPAGKKERSYSIPDSVTSIGSDAFAFCDILASIEIPNSVTSIGDYAFDHCYSLISIIIPDSVTNIGDYAFSFSGLEYIAIPKSVISIGDSAFQSFSNDLTICGYKNSYAETYAKEHLFYFEEIIPMSISISSFIADKASSQTNEKVLVTLTTQADGVGLLKYKYYGYLNGNYIEIEDWTTSNSVTTTLNAVGIYDLWVEVKDLTGTTIKKNLSFCNYDKYGDFGYSYNSIGNEVVITDYLGSAEELNVPSEINDKKVTNIKDHTFYGCENLRSITIPDSITSIGYYVFGRCISLGSITIPNSVTKIESFAFDQCFSLRSITIPDSVTSIGEYAFQSCSNLTSIIIPNSVTNINYYAFHGCNKLTIYGYKNSCAETYAKNKGIPFEEIKPITISSFTTDKVSPQASGTKVTLTTQADGTGSLQYKYYAYLNGKYMEINDWSTNNSVTTTLNTVGTYDLWVEVKDLTGATIKKNLSFRCNCAKYGDFSYSYTPTGNEVVINGYSSLTKKINIPSEINGKKVTSIGDCAFSFYINLTNITIPDSVTSIGDLAFYNCDSLTSITIPNSVTSIGDSAFYGCGSLRSIKIPDSITSIGRSVFAYCGLTNITIPNSVTSIGFDAFYRCDNLEFVDIPNSVTSIGPGAFMSCLNLRYIVVPSSVTSISTNAFTNPQVEFDWPYYKPVYVYGEKGSYVEKYLMETNSEFENVYFEEIIPISISEFTADKVSPQVSSTEIKLTAKTIGTESETLQYRFRVGTANGNSSIIQDYSRSNTATWKANYVGTKILYVDVKDINGKVTTKTMNYVVKAKPIETTISSFTTSKASPQVAGTEVGLTAKATGEGTLQYRFRVGTANGNSSLIKDYSTTNTATWKANYVGTKVLYVDVKDSTGKVVRKTMNYVVKAKPVETTINSFTASKESPQLAGTEIALTAKATGEGTLQYRFRVGTANGNSSLIKDYSTTNTATWKANYVGTKILYVDVKDSTGKVVRKTMNYVVKAKPVETTISSFTASKESPQVAGTEVGLTAKATGEGTLQYRFRVGTANGNSSLIKDYSTTNTAIWKANYVGTKILYVDVKDSTGKVVTKTMNYVVKAKAIETTISLFTSSKESPQVAGTEIGLTAKATGEGTLQYRFRVGTANGNSSLIKDYSTTNIATWKANYAGTKILYVDVKDSTGKVVTKTMTYIVKEPLSEPIKQPTVIGYNVELEQGSDFIEKDYGVKVISNDDRLKDSDYKVTYDMGGFDKNVIGTYNCKAIVSAEGMEDVVCEFTVVVKEKEYGVPPVDCYNEITIEQGQEITTEILGLNMEKYEYCDLGIALMSHDVGDTTARIWVLKDGKYLGDSTIIVHIIPSKSVAPELVVPEQVYVHVNNKTELDKALTYQIDNDDLEVKVDTSKVDLTKVGTYIATYSVKYDPNYPEKEVTKTTKVIVADNPTINVKNNITIKQNAKAQVSDIVESAKDWQGNDITSKVSISGLNTSLVGTQKVTVSVTDSYGFSSVKIVDVSVIEDTPVVKKYKVNSVEYKQIMNAEMYRLIAELRAEKGSPVVGIDNDLQTLARLKNEHMIKNRYFDHEYEGKMIGEYYPNLIPNGDSSNNVLENIYLSGGDSTEDQTEKEIKEKALDVFNMWKDSPLHYNTMIEKRVQLIGFDYTVNEYGTAFATLEAYYK